MTGGAGESGSGPAGHAEADFSRVRTVPVTERPNKVRAEDFARPPSGDSSFHAFFHSLPDILEARSFRAVVAAIVEAARERRPRGRPPWMLRQTVNALRKTSGMITADPRFSTTPPSSPSSAPASRRKSR